MKDVGRVDVREVSVASGYTKSKPHYFVELIAIPDRSDPFLLESDGYAGGKTNRSVHVIRVLIRDQNEANQVADVFRRAAVLCGAPSQPVGMAVAEPAQKAEISQIKPASPASPKMTNADVIQLIVAALSDQVVITSIRQAPTKDFDLTPTGLIALKKAGVSDAVIVVMQERATPAQAASASEAKSPPKYDATLADPPKPAAAPALPTGARG